MKRVLVLLVVLLPLVLAHPARSQPAGKTALVGVLTPGEAVSYREEVLARSLREMGWVEGKNLRLEYRRAGNNVDRLRSMADELVRMKVDLIIAQSTTAVAAAMKATGTIPIVITSADPVGSGFVPSLSRPGGNVTGVSMMMPSLAGKRLELLREFAPKLARVAFLAFRPDPAHRIFIAEMETAGKQLGITVRPQIVDSVEELPAAFTAMKAARVEAVIIQPLFVNTFRRGPQLAELANAARIMSVSDGDLFADEGGLMMYGPDPRVIYRRMATYVDRILRGAKPGDLPVEQPQSFQLVINMKTATSLGLKLPQPVLARADRLVE